MPIVEEFGVYIVHQWSHTCEQANNTHFLLMLLYNDYIAYCECAL
jgi:hypothetical protein